MHLSDLHLGIKVYEFDLYDDQKYMLDQLIDVARKKQVDGIMISGDIYDRQVPPAESVALFDSFLTKLSNAGFKVYITSGNHDSQERLSFGARLMEGSGIYFGGTFDGTVPRIDLEDEFGPVHIFMLPFLKPTLVRAHTSDDQEKEKITGYQEAIDFVLEKCEIDENDRNIIMAHQFVTGASRSDSEEINVGGVDGISADSFARFDYVALGHIHTPQKIGGKDTVRYCGTMLKYSFSECSQEKSVPIITFREKGNVEIELVPLKPVKDMREIKGSYMDLTAKKNYADTNTEDYLHVTLTDEEDVPDALGRLRSIYPNIMKLDYDNLRTRAVYNNEIPDEVEKKSPLDLFDEFYNLQNGRSLNEEESSYVQSKIDELWEGGI
jgi:exonuclease SbcD